MQVINLNSKMDIMETVKAIVILDADGGRILTRSIDKKTSEKQFERKLFIKTKSHKIKDDILVIDGYLVIHRFLTDLHLYILGDKNENPLILESVLNCLNESISALLKTVDRQSILKHLSQIILSLDEMCERGNLLETDSNLVLQRVTLVDDALDLTMAQKLQSATEHIRFPWLRS